MVFKTYEFISVLFGICRTHYENILLLLIYRKSNKLVGLLSFFLQVAGREQ